jgi:hypothetical protein
MWLETPTCNQTKSSAFRFVTGNLKAEDLVSLHVSVSVHKPRKAEDLVSLHISVSIQKPRKAEDLVSLHDSVVMRLNLQLSMVCDWKHLRVMSLNPQPSGLWLETLTCSESKSSAFIFVTGNTYSHKTEGWGFSLITRKCFQSHIMEGWGFSPITRKCFQSQTTKGWGFSLITRMRLNPQPSGLWLETLTCNETKSSAFRVVTGNTYAWWG